MNFKIRWRREPTLSNLADGLVWADDRGLYYTMVYYIPRLVDKFEPSVLKEYLDYRKYRANPIPQTPSENVIRKSYPHQPIGATFCSQGGVLADTVGAGKTQTSYLGALTEKNSKVIVICEKSKKDDWKEEAFQIFDLRTSDVGVIRPGSRKIREKVYRHGPKIIVTSYDLFRIDADLIRKHCQDYTAVIADEAHKFNNSDTQIHRAIEGVTPKNATRIALTATPYEVTPLQLYNICKWTNPEYFPPEDVFYTRFIRYDKWDNPYVLKKRRRELIWILQPCMLRRTWDDVDFDLPPIVPRTIFHDLTPDQVVCYKSLLNNARSLSRQNPQRLKYYTWMMQCCLSPDLVPEFSGQSSKTEVLEELLDDLLLRGHKVVCFTRSKRYVNVLANRFSRHRPACITGDGNDSFRQNEKKRFYNSTNLMFLTSAGERGLNLQCGDTVVNIDVPSNPARFRQRVGRLMRLGQTADQISVYSLVARGTIEDRLMRRAVGRSVDFDQFVQRGRQDTLSTVLATLDNSDFELQL